ncbi:LPS export ABC transporter permease LptF [Azospirillum sp.]|uniref:LPS export ABC transporter permease LptF n=1 Tax=Azospirillum sp. TaxID=34012 RepID=UPI002D6A0FBC|nr:LPS export ABC transporter permease LptF [Azospirillum sp.]HYD68329.1 LPS export ABC transporter permease LptF [Azospirillum sp.]
MNRLQRYLFRNLLVATLYSTAGLTVTIWLSQSLRLIEIVVEAGAPMRLFLWLLLLTVPTFLGIVLPIALVGAVLFTYNKLTMDSEMVVMRAAGVGPFALAKPALVLAGTVAAIVFVLNLWLTPAAHRELVRMEYAVRTDYSQLFLREGVFNEVSEKLSVYVRERDSEGNFHGILIHDSRDQEKPVTIMGERAVLVTGDAGARFVVYNGDRQEFTRKTSQLAELFFDRYAVDLKVLSNSGGERWPDARERSTAELFNPPPEVRGNERMIQQMIAELHHRFTSPLLAVAFTMVALASLLSGEFNRRGQTARVTTAVLLVVLLEAAMLGLTSLSGKKVTFVPLMYALPVLVLIPAGWVLGQGLRRGRHRPAAPHGAAG